MSDVTIKGKNGNYHFDPDALLSPTKGFGRVFKGVCIETGEGIAVKMLHPSLKDSRGALLRFVQEGLMMRYDCPQLIKMMDFCTLDGNAFVVSELLIGSDLKKFLEKNKLSGSDKIIFLTKCFIQLCHALEFLHNKKVYHTDIKPRNLFFLHDSNRKDAIENPHLKLIDLGLAYTDDPAFLNTRLPYSLVYSPPEQILGAKELLGPHTDMYAAGMTFYEFMCGHPPFDSDNPVKLMSMQMNMALPRTTEIPEALMQIIDKTTSKSRMQHAPNQYGKEELGQILVEGIKNRYVNAVDLRVSLEEFLESYKTQLPTSSKSFLGIFKKK
ncbi:MAG: serine/threonine-protein kinase [Bacteroidota bacterium]